MKKKIYLSAFAVLLVGAIGTSTLTGATSKVELEDLVMKQQFKIESLETQLADVTKSLDSVRDNDTKQNNRIQALENQLASNTNTQGKEISEELQQKLLQYYGFYIKSYRFTWNPILNVVKYELVKENGDYFFKVYVEGDYDWKRTVSYDPNDTTYGDIGMMHDESGNGYKFYTYVNGLVEGGNKLYGTNVKFALYENGVQVTPTFEIND